MPKKYTQEKILYFANNTRRLHVAPSEFTRHTDLGVGVEKLLAIGALEKLAEDDSGSYYGTTEAGKLLLLRRQIEWRKQNGFAYTKEQQQLDALQAQQANK